MTFYMGFVVIFAIVYIFNWTIFIAIMVSLMKKQRQSHHVAETKGENIRKQLRAAIAISLLFGLGWGFGFGATQGLELEVLRLIFAVVFTTFTGFQGFFIFVFYCILSERVRKVWNSWLHCSGESKRSILESASRVHKKVIASTMTSSNPLLQIEDDPQYMFNDFVYELTAYELDEDDPILDANRRRADELQDQTESSSNSSRSSSANVFVFDRKESTEDIGLDDKLNDSIVSLENLGSLKEDSDKESKPSSHLGLNNSNVSLSSSDSMEFSLQSSLASDSVLMLEL